MIGAPGPAAESRRARVRDREELVVARLQGLTPHLDGEPDPAFREATRARLVAMAAVRSPEPATESRVRSFLTAGARSSGAVARWRSRMTAGLAGAAMAVTALAALVAVSADAQPGDALYGLKRGTEQTQLALAGDARRGTTLLDFASTRLAELETMLGEGASALPVAGGAGGTDGAVLAAGVDPQLVIDTLATMDAQTAEGVAWQGSRAVSTEDTAILQDLNAWGADQFEGLAALQSRVPSQAQDELTDSLELLAQVDARTDALALAMTCPSGPAVNGSDALGPFPVTCPDDPAGPSAPEGGTPGSDPSPPTTVPGGSTPTPTVPPTGGDPSLPTVPGVPGLPTGGGGSEDGGSGGLPVPLPTSPTLPTNPFDLPPPPPTLPETSVTLPGTDVEVGVGGEDVLRACVPPLIVVNCR